jgi:hypothetical protein
LITRENRWANDIDDPRSQRNRANRRGGHRNCRAPSPSSKTACPTCVLPETPRPSQPNLSSPPDITRALGRTVSRPETRESRFRVSLTPAMRPKRESTRRPWPWDRGNSCRDCSPRFPGGHNADTTSSPTRWPSPLAEEAVEAPRCATSPSCCTLPRPAAQRSADRRAPSAPARPEPDVLPAARAAGR